LFHEPNTSAVFLFIVEVSYQAFSLAFMQQMIAKVKAVLTNACTGSKEGLALFALRQAGVRRKRSLARDLRWEFESFVPL
jgi:hypothetical protein